MTRHFAGRRPGTLGATRIAPHRGKLAGCTPRQPPPVEPCRVCAMDTTPARVLATITNGFVQKPDQCGGFAEELPFGCAEGQFQLLQSLPDVFPDWQCVYIAELPWCPIRPEPDPPASPYYPVLLTYQLLDVPPLGDCDPENPFPPGGVFHWLYSEFNGRPVNPGQGPFYTDWVIHEPNATPGEYECRAIDQTFTQADICGEPDPEVEDYCGNWTSATIRIQSLAGGLQLPGGLARRLR